MKRYIATGYVLGKLWGGGEAAYPSEKIESVSKINLVKKAEKMLDDGSLDSGMGYENLIGAMLSIEEIDYRVIGGKDFSHSEYETIYVGKLSEKQINFLLGTFGEHGVDLGLI